MSNINVICECPCCLNNQFIDIMIIGGGVSGTYMAYRLSKLHPNKRIVLIEKTDIIGGRLNSNYVGKNTYDIACELGGMRFFPIIHPKINNLVKELGLNKVVVPYVHPNNIFYGRKHTFLNKDLFPNTNKVYFLNNTEKITSVFDDIDNNINTIFTNAGVSSSPLYENRKIIFNDPKLCTLSFQNMIMNKNFIPGEINISTDNYQRYMDIGGYKDIFSDKTNFSCAAMENTHVGGYYKKYIKYKTKYTKLKNN
jgi:lysine 2-monooxygenase